MVREASGADLPASAHEEGFPVLVRLNRETFDFRQALANGADIRFSANGQPLAYQANRSRMYSAMHKVNQGRIARVSFEIWIPINTPLGMSVI